MDNRISLPPTPIDFNLVGTTGQDHDTYPAAGQQPRFDWMRLFLIGLLSNQSSLSEPTQYREGTVWFDLNTSTLKIRTNNEWQPISNAIAVDSSTTLSQWFTAIEASLTSIRPEATFSGTAITNNAINISIPPAIQPTSTTNIKPFIWINGLLIDPRFIQFNGTTSLLLTGSITLKTNDRFTVILKSIAEANFITETQFV